MITQRIPASGRWRPFPKWLLPLGLALLFSVLMVSPFFWLGTASGHDFEFHAASWLDVAFQWKQGVLFPRWADWMNHGFGEPRYIFYPPFSWILGAALTLLFPDVAVPVLYIMLVQTFAGLSAYLLLRHFASQRIAVLASICYAINPNALLMTYIRSDFAEQLACAFFPLLLLAALRLCNLLNSSTRTGIAAALFAIPFAAVWLSNAPAAVIASYSMALLFVYAAISQRSCKVLLRGISGILLGLGLASFYLVPAAYEQRWVNIGQALSSGLVPAQNFLFTAIDDVEHTWFNWIASICALTLILNLGLAALASRRFSSSGKASTPNRNTFVALLALGAAASALTMRFTLPLWTYLPKLRFVQFPWRWMSMIALIAVCFVSLAMERRRAWLWFVCLVSLSMFLAYFQTVNGWWDDDEMPTMRDALVSGQGFEGTDEYDPLGDDHADLPVDAPLAKVLPRDSDDSPPVRAQIQIQHWSTQYKELTLDSPSEVRVALRLLNYPAWHVEVNGKQVAPERMDDFNQMVVPVSTGLSRIEVRFTRTVDRTVGGVISVVSILIVMILLIRKREQIPVTFHQNTYANHTSRS